jgi:hypothetical protein
MLLSFTHSFLRSFLFTVVVETATILVIARKMFKKSADNVPTKKLITAGIYASLATLPYVWYVFPSLLRSFPIAIAVGEVFAVGVEAIFYAAFLPLSKKESFALSLIANIASYTLGKLI